MADTNVSPFLFVSQSSRSPRRRASTAAFSKEPSHPIVRVGLYARDDRTIERRINHDNGLEYTTERLSVSPDGQNLTETHLGKRPDGTPYETVLIFQSESEQAATDTGRRWEEALKQFDLDAMQSLLAEDDLQTDFRGLCKIKLPGSKIFSPDPMWGPQRPYI